MEHPQAELLRIAADNKDHMIQDLQHQLALAQADNARLREALEVISVRSIDPPSSAAALFALSTPPNHADLDAYVDAQLGEPVAWKYTRRDGEITATVNKDFALIVEADGFEVTQLYAKKG